MDLKMTDDDGIEHKVNVPDDATVSASSSNDLLCDHLIGIWDAGIGSHTEQVYLSNAEEFENSYDFVRYKYCANCGVKLGK